MKMLSDLIQNRLYQDRYDELISQEYPESKIIKILNNEFPFQDYNLNGKDGYTDYRLVENRRKLVSRNMFARLLAGDLDHWHSAHVAAKYLNLTDEQKAWYSLFFGYSYRTQWATIAIQIWPDPLNVSIDDLHKWANNYIDENGNEVIGNWSRIPVGRDCRYQLRHFPKMLESVQNILKENGYTSLYEYLKQAASQSNDPNENFINLANVIWEFSRFGRMTTFLAMQQLYEFFDWNISGYEMFLGEQNTWSSRTGLIYVDSRCSYTYKNCRDIDALGKPAPNEEFLSYLNQANDKWLKILDEELPIHPDVFNFESEQCESWDKNMMAHKTREYNFWTSQELSELTGSILENWKNYKGTKEFPTIPDLKPLLIAQFTKRPFGMGACYCEDLWFKTTSHVGVPMNLSIFFKDEIDLYKELPIHHYKEFENKEIVNTYYSITTPEERHQYEVEFDPRLYLRWKKNINFNSDIIKGLNDDEVEFIKNLDSMNLYHERK